MKKMRLDTRKPAVTVMPLSCSVLRLSLLLLLLSAPSGRAVVGPTVSCCLKTSETRVPMEKLKMYYIQTDMCPVKAVRFTTVKGITICSDPSDNWAIKAIKHLDAKKKPHTRNTYAAKLPRPSENPFLSTEMPHTSSIKDLSSMETSHTTNKQQYMERLNPTTEQTEATTTITHLSLMEMYQSTKEKPEPLTSAGKHLSPRPTTEESGPTVEQPDPTIEEENASTGKPHPATEVPNSTTEQLHPTTEKTDLATKQLSSTNEDPDPSAYQLYPTTEERDPTAVHFHPTTEELDSTAEQLPEKTEEPDPTSERLFPKTEESGPTSEKFHPTTEELDSTAEQLPEKTEEPDPTSERLFPKTEESGPTSEKFHPTTEELDSTAEQLPEKTEEPDPTSERLFPKTEESGPTSEKSDT
nr:uncharacterized protein LOC111847398 [Paramormyrops kingsleyae]